MCIRDSAIEVLELLIEAYYLPKEQKRAKLNEVNLGLEKLRCLLYTSDAADERSSVDLGGRRIIKKKNSRYLCGVPSVTKYH